MSEDNLQYLYKHLLQKRNNTDSKISRECQSERNKNLNVKELWNKFDFNSVKASKLRHKFSTQNQSSLQTSASAVSFSKYITNEYSKLFSDRKKESFFDFAKKSKSAANQVKETTKTEQTARKAERTTFSNSFSDKYQDPDSNSKSKYSFLAQTKGIKEFLLAAKERKKSKMSQDFSKTKVISPHFTPERNEVKGKSFKSSQKNINSPKIPNMDYISKIIKTDPYIPPENEIQFFKEELTRLYKRSEEVFSKMSEKEKGLEEEIDQLKEENDFLRKRLQKFEEGKTCKKCNPININK